MRGQVSMKDLVSVISAGSNSPSPSPAPSLRSGSTSPRKARGEVKGRKGSLRLQALELGALGLGERCVHGAGASPGREADQHRSGSEDQEGSQP
ncbi:hypothetical protein SAMN05444161_6167 [Rhizobiales bacterium GAS191]|jgi:hypothetical protein|nr:hypothetical protein SAMN05519103_05346 [Rhizobiales bacterium GAS113]SEE55859.1 hypothetical protein SAMN05444161_6167 [Rhizobiales bacterium GAS191]